MQHFHYHHLLPFTSSVLEHYGVPAPDAHQVAACLLLAELRGVDSHGLVRLPVYTRRLEAGVVKPQPSITIEPTGPASLLVDGDNGLGPAVAARAMDAAIHLAQSAGTAFAGVRNSNHFGAAAFYVEKALAHNCIGFAISNAPPNMAAHGGKIRFLGTNPFAVAIPAAEEPPLVFDASSSVAARGKIITAAQQGRAIPPGWAVDPEGNPTTDAPAALAGAVLPFGGAKGSAISFIIDILCGVLTGASFALHLNTLENLKAIQNVGHVFAVLRTDLFLPHAEFTRRMDEILRMLKSTPPAPGVERVLAPGEPEFAKEALYRKEGIPLADETVVQLVELGAHAGAGFPSPVK